MLEKTQAQYARDFQLLEAGTICVAFMAAILGGVGYSGNDASNSRLATVYSLTQYGTWAIDRPETETPIRFEQDTIDKVMIDGHLLSAKPPMLSLAMTGEYLLLNKVFGLSLDREADLDKILRFMSVTLIGISYFLALLFFTKTLYLFMTDPLLRVVLLFALAFCTQLWGFSTHINNHVPATGMLMASVYWALGIGEGKLAPTPWRFFLFGLTGGLVPTLDPPATIFVLFAGLYLLVKQPARTVCWVTLGATIPIGVHCVAMLASTGSLLPVQSRPALFLYESSYWRNPQGVDALSEPKGTYLFHMTFGRCGLFSLYPVLFTGIVAAIRGLYRKGMPFRAHVLVSALAFLIMTAYYVFKTNNYGGEAYGFRWYIAVMPILLLMGVPVFAALKARWKWIFVSLMIGISFCSASECMRSPWGANHQWTCRLFLGPSYGPIQEPEDRR